MDVKSEDRRAVVEDAEVCELQRRCWMPVRSGFAIENLMASLPRGGY
jgi:hypothetical protein